MRKKYRERKGAEKERERKGLAGEALNDLNFCQIKKVAFFHSVSIMTREKYFKIKYNKNSRQFLTSHMLKTIS